MEIAPLVDVACERAGCSDFGKDTWQEGLGVLVQSLNDEAALSEMGVAAMTDQIVGYLANSAYGATTPFFGLFNIPPLIGKDEDLANQLLILNHLFFKSLIPRPRYRPE